MTSLLATVPAPAKINLYLRVKGRRPDGYHELESVMQKLVLADFVRVAVDEGSGIALSCPAAGLPEDDTNLAWRAARLFLDETGLERRVAITLDKKIPVAAGLGGGSSDAAAVLLVLNELLRSGLDEEALLKMAVRLGADVPFFIKDHCPAALAEGIGERLSPVAGIQNCDVVLVNPGFPVSTRWVFANFALTTNRNPYILAPGKDSQSGIYFGPDEADFLKRVGPEGFFNDLEAVTIDRYPEIESIKNSMLAEGAMVALMSGSGPTVFGIFTDHRIAISCFEKFRSSYGKNVFLTRPRHF
ncbi:MAG: 4-(cytidine 5'-diphospho)-2-C-methyl-D-erythritol kinase [Desulfurivibrionaceae bacterium]|nr:4-(cytidine 5'-diphospho)-2-C-methyl-D-erythritol kinase [Desulfurivibrionaceae bacterium]